MDLDVQTALPTIATIKLSKTSFKTAIISYIPVGYRSQANGKGDPYARPCPRGSDPVEGKPRDDLDRPAATKAKGLVPGAMEEVIGLKNPKSLPLDPPGYQ